MEHLRVVAASLETPAVKHVFLTGDPGVGKSTIVSRVRARLATAVEAVGFVTLEQRDPEQGQRIGFRSINVADAADSVQLASLEEGDGPRVGPFRVNLAEVTAFCRRTLSPASAATRPRLHFMDEIGAMQLLSAELEQLFGSVVDGSCHCFGTLPTRGLHDLTFVEGLRGRADVRVLEVTEDTRDGLVDVVCSLLYRVCFSAELAESIEAKATLAKRYVTELDSRLESTDHGGLAFRFAGDHGFYEMQRSSREGAFECSCTFF